MILMDTSLIVAYRNGTSRSCTVQSVRLYVVAVQKKAVLSKPPLGTMLGFFRKSGSLGPAS